MTDELIPADIQDFIIRHIDSVTQLEALLLLRSNAGETWNLSMTAKRLYTTEHEVAEVLALLCHDGLLSVSEGVYRYDGATPEQQSLVDRLAALYSRHLISVTKLIHAKPRRIRQFADAFRLRKER
jgi:D-serine deaminase-like pyridoxal phosphate-dependent protein